uniref:Retrotransposon gag protein n=1 Tax=Solanum tuberosum TaxID=4113 RepID=M1DTF0_SOLTU
MGSTTHVDKDKKEFAKDVHRLARLGVRIMDSNEGRVAVVNGDESALVLEVKEKQDQDPILLKLKIQVTKITIQCFVDPIEHSESVGEPPQMLYINCIFTVVYSCIELSTYELSKVEIQVTKITIQCFVDPIEHSESVGEPPCFRRIPFYCFIIIVYFDVGVLSCRPS